MEPLKPRDKVTQHMTRDGLTLDNQTTGESVNVSSREAEQEYTAQPEGAAEKILERADELHDCHKAKKAAKDAGETVAQATDPVSQLQFTAEERASPELAPYIKKAEKRADQLEAAKEALPKKRVVTKETVYDEAKGKAKTKLHFDKVEKPAPKLKPNPASRPMEEAGLYLHGKIHEVEHENVGVECGHKGEELAERQAGKAIRSGIRRHKLKPYRAAAKAERKSIAANAEFAYQKSLRDNPELAQAAKNPVSRFWQKQHIKREYAKVARAAGQTAQGAAGTAKTTGAAAKKAAEKSRQAASFAARHWKGALIVGGVGLMLLLVMGGLQSCTAMFGSTGTGLAATSYLSEDSDMLGAEAAYAALEADLQHELDNYESLHPGYDEYRFDLDEIGHDPYVLTSILSALHDGVCKIDFSVFNPVDVGIGVRQAGKGLSEVALGIAELLRKGLGLVFHFPSGNPAAGAESRMDGGAGLFIKLRPQREGDTFFKRQRFTDDAGGELEQPFVAQVHQGVHDAGNQRLRLVGKDAVRPVGRGHEGNKKLRQGFRTAEGEGIVGVGKTARSFSFDFAGSAVVQHAEVVVPSQKAGHLPYLYGEFRTCFRVDVEQPASRGQSIV